MKKSGLIIGLILFLSGGIIMYLNFKSIGGNSFSIPLWANSLSWFAILIGFIILFGYFKAWLERVTGTTFY